MRMSHHHPFYNVVSSQGKLLFIKLIIMKVMIIPLLFVIYYEISNIDPNANNKEEYYKSKNEINNYYPPKAVKGKEYGFSPKEGSSDKVKLND
jgi:hypothetical protein